MTGGDYNKLNPVQQKKSKWSFGTSQTRQRPELLLDTKKKYEFKEINQNIFLGMDIITKY